MRQKGFVLQINSLFTDAVSTGFT